MKRSTKAAIAEAVTIWDTLADVLAERIGERPPDSVTPDELAQKMGCSYSYAARILQLNKRLRAVPFRGACGKRAVCYVVAG